MQTLETGALRLPTTVTVSPASRRRSSSAAQRISSITSGRRSQNSAVSSSEVSATPSQALSIARGAASSATVTAARENRPVPAFDHARPGGAEPLLVDVLGVHAQALGQRDAVVVQALAYLD